MSEMPWESQTPDCFDESIEEVRRNEPHYRYKARVMARNIGAQVAESVEMDIETRDEAHQLVEKMVFALIPTLELQAEARQAVRELALRRSNESKPREPDGGD